MPIINSRSTLRSTELVRVQIGSERQTDIQTDRQTHIL